MPVFGREGRWLPLGPVVQHTGELKDEPVIEEMWLFGEPDPTFSMHTDQLKTSINNGKIHLSAPDGVQLQHY